jgi:hypothetical protein
MGLKLSVRTFRAVFWTVGRDGRRALKLKFGEGGFRGWILLKILLTYAVIGGSVNRRIEQTNLPKRLHGRHP